VLVAYLQGGLVDGLGWLTQRQLIDAVAAGQVTPGPLISTATFAGYIVGHERGPGGGLGAAAATAAIILPGLVLVAAVNPLIPRLRRWPWAARFLDAVNAASVGLTAAVTVRLAQTALVLQDGRPWLFDLPIYCTGQPWLIDGRGCLIALLAAAAFFGRRLPAVWIVLGGAILGRLLY
jgi:chromate transporter